MMLLLFFFNGCYTAMCQNIVLIEDSDLDDKSCFLYMGSMSDIIIQHNFQEVYSSLYRLEHNSINSLPF